MKINSKVLSIPPYISTSWDNITSLQVTPFTGILHILLKNKVSISIPNLSGNTLEEIFQAHADFLDQNHSSKSVPAFPFPPGALGIGFAETAPSGITNFSGAMQHDPSQKNNSPLPLEILQKISQVAKALDLDEDAFSLSMSEPHCNCPYCQIVKAIHQDSEEKPTPDIDNKLPPIADNENILDDKELKFREWDIEEVSEKLYRVSNPFDAQEHYQVFLGQPMGCTCGKNNCDHILAVLHS